MASASQMLSNVPSVKIDQRGRYKYVLIRVLSSDEVESKYVVRGFSWAGYHADIYEDFEKKLPKGLICECLGGGRIEHHPDAKKILVYGYSMGFGRADHSITVGLLKEAYPTYSNITFSNEGY